MQAIRKKTLSPQGREVRLRTVRGVIIELAKKRVLDEFDEEVETSALRLAKRVEAGKLSVGEAARLLSER